MYNGVLKTYKLNTNSSYYGDKDEDKPAIKIL